MKNGARDLGDISGANGRLQDLRDGYGLTRELYEAAWRRENRPYWLQNVLTRYDMAMQLWIGRAERFAAAASEMARTRRPRSFEAVGIPAPLPAPAAPAAATPPPPVARR